jgi:hypothetical protein
VESKPAGGGSFELRRANGKDGDGALSLLAKKEAQSKREEKPKKGRSPLDADFMKTVKKGGPDAAMEMALQVKDPLIQANLTRILRVTRGEETRSSNSDSPTKDEEEDTRAVRERHVWANQQQGLEKGREARGRRRADPPESGKELKKKVKRSKDDKEVEKMGTDKAQQLRGDLEMTEVKGPPEREFGHKKGDAEPTGRERERSVAADAERGRLQEEKEDERLKQEQTQEEGCKLMPESFGRVLNKAKDVDTRMLNDQKRQEPEKEPASQKLTELLKGVRAQCAEVKGSLRKVVELRGGARAQQSLDSKEPRGATTRETSLNTGADKFNEEQPLNLSPVDLPDAPPAAPVEMMDVQVQMGENIFQGRQTWDMTFLSTGYVRVEKFFKMKSEWPPNIRGFKFQNEALPALLG